MAFDGPENHLVPALQGVADLRPTLLKTLTVDQIPQDLQGKTWNGPWHVQVLTYQLTWNGPWHMQVLTYQLSLVTRSLFHIPLGLPVLRETQHIA